jgi:anti-sigma factor RsiW
MVDCSEIRPLLSAFSDGELEPAELLKVARHLAGCPQCESEAADLGALGAHLRESFESAVSVIPMAGFVEAVQARIAGLKPSPWRRLRRWFESLDQAISPTISVASAALAAAALTAILLTPYARQYTTSSPPQQLASNSIERPAPVAKTPSRPAEMVTEAEKTLVEDSRAIISRLESENPAVAVWSEPRTDTTVIWLPDQRVGR